MPEINSSARELVAKIVYVGPGLSGKTTNLKAVHRLLAAKDRGQIIEVNTEGERTLFFDLLPLGEDVVPKLFGYTVRHQLLTVPGQIYYTSARRLVMKNADGIVFVADSAPERLDATIESMEDLHRMLLSVSIDPATIPIVLQFNKRDLPGALSTDVMADALNVGGWPMYQAVATEGTGVMETLAEVLRGVHKSLRKTVGGGAG